MNKFKEWMSGKKKLFMSLLAAGLTVYGHRNGWDRETTSTAAWMLMSGVGVEGAIDVAALIFRRDKPNGG